MKKSDKGNSNKTFKHGKLNEPSEEADSQLTRKSNEETIVYVHNVQGEELDLSVESHTDIIMNREEKNNRLGIDQ